MSKFAVHSIESVLNSLVHMPDRSPRSEGLGEAACRLAAYRDGGIFLVDYTGSSEWERHLQGDEIVVVLDGWTRLILLVDGEEMTKKLARGELLVVPRGTWHRFESPERVKVMTVTPQPTDHSLARPQ